MWVADLGEGEKLKHKGADGHAVWLNLKVLGISLVQLHGFIAPVDLFHIPT